MPGRLAGLATLSLLMALLALPGSSAAAPTLPQEGNATPHSTEGRTDCLYCHGEAGSHPQGPGHEGVTNHACLACHTLDPAAPAAGSSDDPLSAYFPPVPHTLSGRSDCLLCHGEAGPMFAGPDHEGRHNESCLNCHARSLHPKTGSSFLRASSTPHSLKGRTYCFGCHDRDAPLPFGTSHNGRPLSTCLACHPVASDLASQRDVIDDPDPVPATLDAGCFDCHSNRTLAMTFPSGESLSVYVDAEKYRRSLHGDSLNCGACHPDIHDYPHPPREAASRRAYALENSEACKSCHFENYTRSLDGMHFKVRASGDLAAPTCTDCHGAHDVQGIREEGLAASLTCAGCHAEIYDSFAASVHGEAVTQGNPDVPGCTACHEAHANHDPRTMEARVVSHETCGKCHADASIMDRYGLSTDVLSTFAEDFHGLTLAFYRGSPPDHERLQATCVDCHGVHDIKRSEDPESRVAKGNIADTCRTCHADATDSFPTAWLGHYRPSPTQAPVVYWIRQFYNAVIPLTVGGLSLHILLDLFRITINRIRRRRYL